MSARVPDAAAERVWQPEDMPVPRRIEVVHGALGSRRRGWVAVSHGSRRLGRFAAFLFDLDGVVTDTARLHAEAWKATFDRHLPALARRFGVPEMPFDVQSDYRGRLDGRGGIDGARLVLAARGISLPQGFAADAPGAPTVRGLANEATARFTSLLESCGAQPYPATIDLCERLVGFRVERGLVTSSRSCGAVLASARLDGLFDPIVDGVLLSELGLPGKPDPAPFLEAARRLGVDPVACVAVDDGVPGVEAARAAGVGLVVGVERTGEGPHHDGLARLADAIVAEVDEFDVRPPISRPAGR